MQKVLVISLALFLGVGIGLFADCATQSDGTVSFTITINPGAGSIHRVVLTFQVSTGDPTSLVVSTPVASPDLDGSLADTDGGDVDAPWELWTNTINKSIGYHAIYEPSLDEIYFGKNPVTDLGSPPSGGVFTGSDLNEFTLQISGLVVPYEITGVTVTAQDLSYNPIPGGATLAVTPCNQAPNIDDIDITYSTTVPRNVTLTAAPPTGQDLDEDADGDLTAAWSSTDTTIPGTTISESLTYTTLPTDDPDSVSVTITDTDGASTTFGPVSVNPNDRPVVDDIVPTADPGVPLRVGFAATTSDPDGVADTPVTYIWNFGDPTTGANNTSTVASPTHDFSADGNFTISLTVTDFRGLPSLEYQEVVNPDDVPSSDIVPPPSGLRIKGTLHVGEAPLVVQLTPSYTDDTSAAPSELRWDLDGNGSYETIDNSGLLNPQTVILEETGQSQISLIAVEKTGFNSTESTIFLAAYPNERASFPRAIGVPYDAQRSPEVDGIITGPDGVPEPTGETDAGEEYGENAWRGSYQVPYGDGSDPHVTVDLIRDNSDDSLYIGMEVSFDNSLTSNDVIVLGIGQNDDARIFDTGGTTGLIVIDPNTLGVAAYTKIGTDWLASADPGILVAVQPTPPSGSSWSAEIKLPVGPGGPDYLDLDGEFLFFVDFFREDSSPPTMVRFSWPRTIPDVTSITDLTSPQFDPLWWGLAYRDDSMQLTGLSLPSYSHVGTEHPTDTSQPLTSSIRYEDSPSNAVVNKLIARVVNNAHKPLSSGQVQLLDAENVSVEFRIANWGIPSDPGYTGTTEYWDTIVTTGNPTTEMTVARHPAGVVTLPGGGTATVNADGTADAVVEYITEFSANWVLIETQINEYDPDVVDADGVNEKHQCILVEITMAPDTTGTADPTEAVNIVTRSVHRNMNFDAGTSSPYEHDAEISAFGYDFASLGEGDRTFLLRIYTKKGEFPLRKIKQTKEKADSAKPAAVSATVNQNLSMAYASDLWPFIKDAEETVSFTEYIVKAFLYTGRKVVNNGIEYDEVVPVGSYGHVVRNYGEVENWLYQIVGAEKINDTTYRIQIAKDTVATVTDVIEPITPPDLTAQLSAGITIPLEVPGASYGVGPLGAVDIGWQISRDYSLHGIGWYSYLPAAGATPSPRNLFGAALSIRRHFFTDRLLRPYIGIGANYIVNDPGIPQPGILGTAGLHFAAAKAFHVGLGADVAYHPTSGALILNLHVGGALRVWLE